MKRKFLLLLLSLVTSVLYAQTCQQTDIELDCDVSGNSIASYIATSSIRMLAGFHCYNSVQFSIDRFGVFPPEDGYLGGPPLSGHDGVVGALPGQFDVSDMGAAVYNVSIMTPNGIGDMTPQISVTYNNQSGNGLLGWGWHLSGLSEIVRVGQTVYHDGNKSAINFVDDRFAMDGKRLMLFSGEYGGNGSVYKTEIDEMSKIISYTDSYDGPARFVVYKKDGTIWEYGCTEDSRVEPQERNDVVLTWRVNKIMDHDGNYMSFNYLESQATGETYINRIDYTLNDNAGINAMFRMSFAYDDRTDAEMGYVFENLVQKRKILKSIVITNMMTGTTLYEYSFDYYSPNSISDDYKFMYYRLKSIGLTANGMKINPTIISWNKKNQHYPNKVESYSLNKNTFNKVPFTGDFNGDGYSDVITVPYKTGNVYLEDVPVSVYLNNGNGSFNNNALCTITLDKTLDWIYVVDFNGDGLDDIVPYFVNDDENGSWKTKIYVYLNNGNSFTYIGGTTSDRLFTIYPGVFDTDRKVSFFLFNDNKNYSTTYIHSIVYCDNNTVVKQSLGQQSCLNGLERIVVEDIDGDGISEVICLMEDNSAMMKLARDDTQYVINMMHYDGNFDSEDFFFPGDFNGDGYTDFLKYDNVTYWTMAFSDGHKLLPPIPFLNNNLLRGLTLAPQDRYICSLESLAQPAETIRIADMDGDGKADVCVFKNTGGNYYLEVGFKVGKTTGDSYNFGDIKRFYLNINHGHQFIHLGNYLGRENVSVLGSVRTTPNNTEIPKIVSLNSQSSKYSVERITDGLGNMRGFRYEYLMPYNNSFYDYDYQLVDDDLRAFAMPIKALCSDTIFSTNGNPNVTQYSYKNAFYHNKGHGFLGFEKCVVKHYINKVLSDVKYMESDADCMGNNYMILPNKILIYNSNNQIIRKEQYSYLKYQCLQNDKIIMPLVTVKKTLNYAPESPGSILSTDIENTEYVSDVSNNYYLNFVNVNNSIVGKDESYTGDDAAACSYNIETDYVYDNKVNQWIVDRPKRITKKEHYGDNAVVGSCEIFDYSGSNPYQIVRTTSLPNANLNYADPLKIVTEYSYDVVGNKIMKSTNSPSSKGQRISRVIYGNEYNYRLPTVSINENGWEMDKSYDNDYGILKSSLDYNQFETECYSDPFEVTTEKNYPDGIKIIKTKRWAQGNEHAPSNAMFFIWEKTSGYAETMTFYSKNGKKLREVCFDLNRQAVYVDMAYDDKGNLISQSMPYKAGDNVENFYYNYDAYNRLLEEVCPNGLVKNYSYDKLRKSVVSMSPDGVSHLVVETVNPLGWVIKTVDIGGNIINYEYYSDGKLKSTMIEGNDFTKVEYEYDNRRNMSKMVDPAMGETTYNYNAYGEIVQTKTSNHAITTYQYDMIGNMISREESDESGQNIIETQWIYDNSKGKIGTLSRITYGKEHEVDYVYDDYLRITTVNEVVNGNKYSTNYSYDNASREEMVVYPSGFAVQKHYSNSGCYKSMTTLDDKVLWCTVDADAVGNITDYIVGNNLTTKRTYDTKTNYLNGIKTANNGVVYQDLSYSYDVFGNLVNRTKSNGTLKSESFTYDSFNRLEEIKMNNVLAGIMTYDKYGNIISKKVDDQYVFYNAIYEGRCPYTLTQAKTDNNELTAFHQSVKYTTFNKIKDVSCANNSMSIEYGYDHERIHSVEIVDGKKKEKTYLNDCEYVNDNGNKTIYTYLKGPMGVFAIVVSDDKGNNAIMYIHKDHLDSWCLVTDENGKVIQDVSFDAWGNQRNADTWSGLYKGELLCDRGFTGHEHLSSFGIINMNGRAYDPILSMMMSPDDYIQNPDFSQNYNRYSYCYNNPLSYCDPSGEWVEWLLFGAFNGVMNVLTNFDIIDNLAEGALVFGAGFVSGCLMQGFSECSWALQVVGNVAGSTLTAGVNSFVKQNTSKELDMSILDSKDFKHDVMYALGSNIAKSALTANYVRPSEGKPGVNALSRISNSKVNRNVIKTAAGKMVGNIFAGDKMLEGFNFNGVKDYVPYAQCIYDLFTEGIEFEASSTMLGAVFDKLLNFDCQAILSAYAQDANNCYSQIRSLFLKN